MAASTFTAWLKGLPIPWLFGGPNGQNDAAAQGAVYDQQVSLLREAGRADEPDSAPSDALALVGSNRTLIQGTAETDASFRARLKDWGQYARAGTFVGLLEQLYYSCGIAPLGAVICQQNGAYWTLTSAPTPGADPTALVTVTATNVLSVALHSSVTPTRSIPIGKAWWTMDSNTDLCSRFQILILSNVLAPMFMTRGTATFTASDTATVTWNNSFPDATYKIKVGAPIATDLSSGIVTVSANASSRTLTTTVINATGAFTGTVDCVAYQSGANPYADPHPADLLRLRTIINTWRPAKAPCVDVRVLTRGGFMGYPTRTIGSSAPVVGAEVVSFTGGY